ncbi:MAG: hypothetical protein IPK04_05505 [Bdellovibrionales bacterium]|nr:hypothetical protein [Bdellovibrionales bacterium]
MSRSLVLFIVGLFSIAPLAQASWEYGILRASEAPKGFKEYGILERYVDTNHGRISVATVSLAVYEKSASEPNTEDAAAAKMASLIRGLTWKKEVQKGVFIYTAYLKPELRYFKMMIKDLGKKRIVTIANIRQPYVLGTAYETEYLQRIFMKKEVDNKRATRKTALYWSRVFEEAEAQTISNFDFQRLLGAYANSLGQAGAKLADQLVGVRNAVVSTTDRALSIGEGVVSEGRNISNSINNAASAARDAAKAGREISAQGKDTTVALRGMVDDAKRTVDDNTNKLVDESQAWRNEAQEWRKQATNKRLISQLSLISGLSFSVGSFAGTMLCNLISSGAFTLLREAFYALTGKLKPELMDEKNKRATAALSELDASINQINNLEKEIGLLGMGLSEIEKAPGRDVIESIGEQVVVRKNELRKMIAGLNTLRNQTDINKCATDIRMKEDEIYRLEQNSKTLFQTKKKGAVCEKIHAALLSWQLAAASLHRAKHVVTQEITTILGNAEKRNIEAFSDPASPRNNLTECKSVKEIRLEQLESEYTSFGCDKNQSNPGCTTHKQNIEAQRASILTCQADVDMIAATNDSESAAHRNSFTQNAISITREQLHKVARLDCRMNDPRKFCIPGEEGHISILNDLYAQKIAAFKQTCPEVTLNPLANPAISPKSLADQLPNPIADQASAKDAPPPLDLPRWWKKILESFK